MLSRRQFLTRSGTLGAVAVFAPQSLPDAVGAARLLRGGRFSSGVMSGDPTPRGITLWTHVANVEGRGGVLLEVARDRDFRNVVTRKTIQTRGSVDHTVKARVERLRPHERYYYRFETATRNSPVGRFQTALPKDSNQPVRLGYFSCQNYPHGWYNAHELMAREDLDFVVNLGDYIYAEAYHSRKDGTGVRDDRIGRSRANVIREAVSLSDYRDKYKLYRSDADLRKLHARFPMVSTWDDHEAQDNYAGGAADGGLPPDQRFSQKRRRAGYQAFFEHMPHFAQPRGRDRLYRSLRFGRNVDLIMLDERQYRDNQPCNDAVAEPCPEYNNPRTLLGAGQKAFFKGALERSSAAWKLVGNEVAIMPVKTGANTYFTYDFWHGYPGERREILEHIKAKGIKDVVFLTGDIHTFAAGDVQITEGGESVATEIIGGSVTSLALGEGDIPIGGGIVLKGNDANPNTAPEIINALVGLNPWVDYADFDHHGYVVVEATRTQLTAKLRRIDTIKKRSAKRLPDVSYTIARGDTSLKGKRRGG
jgi:alkaline phosphatase D